jgi:hypothetical protein
MVRLETLGSEVILMRQDGMSRRAAITLGLLLLSVPVFRPTSAAGRGTSTNLILNGSFESGGVPSLEGWQAGNPALATLVAPGSPGGGDWGLRLDADWAPTLGYVTQAVHGIQSGDIVELRAEVKAMGLDGGGAIRIVVGQDFWQGRVRSVATDSEEWTTLSVVDTLEIEEGDSVWVQLTSFHTEVVTRVGLFDAVSMTVLGSVPVAPRTWGSLKTMALNGKDGVLGGDSRGNRRSQEKSQKAGNHYLARELRDRRIWKPLCKHRALTTKLVV